MHRFICTLFLFLISPTLWADQLIIEPDMGRAPIIDAVNQSKYKLDLVMYGFTDPDILKPLLAQQSKGRSLRVILERNPYKATNENQKTISAFTDHQVNWQGDIPPFRLIHQKTLLIDDQKALIMTFNFTRASFKNERNFALLIDDPKRVKKIADIFLADWNHKPTQLSLDQDDLFYSPENSQEKLIALMGRAHSSLQIYAQSISDIKITDALAKAAKRGVQVSIITSAPLHEKQASRLQQAGVRIHYNKKYYIHAKAMIIDQRAVLIGSINFTQPSLNHNRELSVLSKDPQVIAQLNRVFNDDWNNSEKPAKQMPEKLLDNKQLVRTVEHYARLFARELLK